VNFDPPAGAEIPLNEMLFSLD